MAQSFDAVLRMTAQAKGAGEVRQLTAAIGQLRGSAQAAERGMSGLGAVLGGIGISAATVGLAGLGQQIASAGIQSDMTQRRMRALASSTGELAQMQGIATRAAAQFGLSNVEAQNAVTDLYGRLQPMGVTIQEIETVFFGVNKAAAMFGLSAEDLSGVMLQLSQALGSGKLQGDELRSLMERMPAIGQAVAKVMGVTVGEIKQLGADGKITTDVMIQAMKELNQIQPPPPTAFQKFRAELENSKQLLGEALFPVLEKVANQFNRLGLFVQAATTQNKDGLGRFVKASVETTKALIPVAYNLLKVYAGFKLLQGMIVAATLATKAFALVSAMTPQGLLMLGASAVVGFAAFAEIEKKMNAITAGMGNTATNTNDFGAEAAKALGSVDGIASGMANAAGSSEKLKVSAEQRAKWEQMLDAQIAISNARFDQRIEQANAIGAAIQRNATIAQEENTLAQGMNNLGRTILQNRLDQAKTDEEKLAITRQIAALEAESAKLQYQATLMQIEADRQLVEVKYQAAAAEEDKARAALRTAMLQFQAGQLEEKRLRELTDATIKARSAANSAQADLATANRLADIRRRQAGVTMQASTIQATGATAAPVSDTPRSFTTVAGIRIPQYATGGFVTRPTLAMIGEGGEPEYVVPESKALGFAAAMNAGKRGREAMSWTEQMRIGHLAPEGGFISVGQKLRALESRGIFATFSPLTGLVVRRRTPPRLGGGTGSMFIPRPNMAGTPVQSLGPVEIKQNLQVGRVERRSDGDYVTLSDAQRLAGDASRGAVAEVVRLLQQPAFRREVGIR